jgi:hypothetical protein
LRKAVPHIPTGAISMKDDPSPSINQQLSRHYEILNSLLLVIDARILILDKMLLPIVTLEDVAIASRDKQAVSIKLHQLNRPSKR